MLQAGGFCFALFPSVSMLSDWILPVSFLFGIASTLATEGFQNDVMDEMSVSAGPAIFHAG